MAMRITTKMMQNTSLRNLNTNKARQEMLTTQLSTGKKISRPSDDPVISIRSLKLNSSLTKIDQFYEKNASDAESWIELTESAISTVNDILKDVRSNINQAATGHLEATDRDSIMENLINSMAEIYSTGNADSGGRSLFTGYRTDLPLVFKYDKHEHYKITEQVTNQVIDSITYVATGPIKEISEGNFNTDEMKNATQFEVSTNEIFRIRLSYDKLDSVTDNNDIVFEFGDFSEGGATTRVSAGTNGIKVFESGTQDAYMTVVEDPDALVYIAATGELLMGKNKKEELAALDSNMEMRITYEKSNWEEGDIDPVHFFYTERKEPKTDRVIPYNEKFLKDGYNPNSKQIIEYDIGNNQTLRVNTTADELFNHDMGRDVEEVVAMLNEYGVLDDNYITIKGMIESGNYEGEDLITLEKQLDAIGKARTMVGDKVQKRCESLLTDCDGYISRTTLAETNCGSRGSRLKLVKNRLNIQQTNYQELVSSNEDADYTDLAIQLKSVEMTYEAALSSISYVMQTSLLDFIR